MEFLYLRGAVCYAYFLGIILNEYNDCSKIFGKNKNKINFASCTIILSVSEIKLFEGNLRISNITIFNARHITEGLLPCI